MPWITTHEHKEPDWTFWFHFFWLEVEACYQSGMGR